MHLHMPIPFVTLVLKIRSFPLPYNAVSTLVGLQCGTALVKSYWILVSAIWLESAYNK